MFQMKCGMQTTNLEVHTKYVLDVKNFNVGSSYFSYPSKSLHNFFFII